MQRFTLIHDGSKQGWQAAYLAFYVAAQLGAPLQVLMVISNSDTNTLAKRAAQVEVGGHAAGVAITTQTIAEFSINAVAEASSKSNGLFVPSRLISDKKTARDFLEVLSCPLWLVSKESETNGIAMLAGNPIVEETMINYAIALSHRIQQPLNGFVLESEFAHFKKTNSEVAWHQLPDFSPPTVSTVLKQVNVSLLILPLARFSISDELSFNCVIYPVDRDA
ncbi:MAG: hypothetical protein PVJ21_14540 [Anaerolineales bacterium]|jgi:hypothetical protein